jgi:hypothetical protein
MVLGSKGLSDFGQARMAQAPDGIFDDTFYTLFSPNSGRYCELREGVAKWIEKLRQNKTCSGMVLEILDLVENRMLKVDAGDRVNAEELEVFLRKQLEKGELDLVYLVGDAQG